jgi:hypothetical protein
VPEKEVLRDEARSAWLEVKSCTDRLLQQRSSPVADGIVAASWSRSLLKFRLAYSSWRETMDVKEREYLFPEYYYGD